MGLDTAVIDGAVRVSLCRDNTTEDLQLLVQALEEAKSKLKG